MLGGLEAGGGDLDVLWKVGGSAGTEVDEEDDEASAGLTRKDKRARTSSSSSCVVKLLDIQWTQDQEGHSILLSL